MNQPKTIQSENLQRIHFDKFEKDFSFIVNGTIYKTNSFVANILSPTISKLFEKNMKTSCYQINIEYEGDFNQIIQYGEMKTIKINSKQNQYFRNIMKQLGNSDEALQFSKVLQEKISFGNIIERINVKKELDINLNEEIEFISSNFHEFHSKYPEALTKFGVDIVEQIISNNKLIIYDEKELFDIILQLYLKSKDYSSLFSYIIFMNLSKESIQEFIKHFDINYINKFIWEKISLLLKQDISIQAKESYQKSYYYRYQKRYLPKKRQENIFQYLNQMCGANAHMKEIIQITSSSQSIGTISNIIEKNDSDFATTDALDSWIQFDFKERNIIFDSYTLKSGNYEFSRMIMDGDEPLTNWALEVSNDGQYYRQVDRQTNCDLLKERLKTATFKVSISTPVRFVRLRRLGKNSGFSHRTLRLSQIEFSGYIYE